MSRFAFSTLRRRMALVALGAAVLLSGTALPHDAQALDCAFFREHAVDRHDLDYSARMLAACEALAAYRETLLRENVRYAFGEQAVHAGREAMMRRAAPLDTFHVLSEMEQYRIAREAQVFDVIIEIP
ncbi:MAG: hypothetical protein AAFT19_05140 [Pseudomonadota bacterium]